MTPTELCSPGASGQARTALVGFGNPLGGDDAIGPLVARGLHEALGRPQNCDLLELCTSDFGVMERLIGYQRAVIIDALVDEAAEVGAVKPVQVSAHACAPSIGLHTAGFEAALALARMLGLEVPPQVAVYGIVIREPLNFGQSLSAALEARLPEIVAEIAALLNRD